MCSSDLILLLVLPSTVFKRVVVVLIAIALVLVVLQPRIARWLSHRGHDRRDVRPLLIGLVALTGVYGGYFGAAQGIILISLLGIFIDDDLQRLNAVKNVLAMSVNLMASTVFVLSTEVDWAVVGLIAAGSIKIGRAHV